MYLLRQCRHYYCRYLNIITLLADIATYIIYTLIRHCLLYWYITIFFYIAGHSHYFSYLLWYVSFATTRLLFRFLPLPLPVSQSHTICHYYCLSGFLCITPLRCRHIITLLSPVSPCRRHIIVIALLITSAWRFRLFSHYYYYYRLLYQYFAILAVDYMLYILFSYCHHWRFSFSLPLVTDVINVVISGH